MDILLEKVQESKSKSIDDSEIDVMVGSLNMSRIMPTKCTFLHMCEEVLGQQKTNHKI